MPGLVLGSLLDDLWPLGELYHPRYHNCIIISILYIYMYMYNRLNIIDYILNDACICENTLTCSNAILGKYKII